MPFPCLSAISNVNLPQEHEMVCLAVTPDSYRQLLVLLLLWLMVAPFPQHILPVMPPWMLSAPPTGPSHRPSNPSVEISAPASAAVGRACHRPLRSTRAVAGCRPGTPATPPLRPGRPACLRIASPDSVWRLGCRFDINYFLPDNSILLPRTPLQQPATKRISNHQNQPSFEPPASPSALPSEYQPDFEVSFISSFWRLHAIITLHLVCF